ncbi:MAG: response regulator transcription factor [Nitrospiraceae bacterium]|nr:response regulator transcription factor [Nitrospiraceae bacterium]
MRHADGAQSIFAAGASGVLYRFSAATELSLAVDAVLSDRQYLSSAFTTSSDDLERLRSHETGALSPSDEFALRLVARGYPLDQIARSIGQSVETVQLSLASLKRQLGRHTGRELQPYAVEHDLDPVVDDDRDLADIPVRLYPMSSLRLANNRKKDRH